MSLRKVTLTAPISPPWGGACARKCGAQWRGDLQDSVCEASSTFLSEVRWKVLHLTIDLKHLLCVGEIPDFACTRHL